MGETLADSNPNETQPSAGRWSIEDGQFDPSAPLDIDTFNQDIAFAEMIPMEPAQTRVIAAALVEHAYKLCNPSVAADFEWRKSLAKQVAKALMADEETSETGLQAGLLKQAAESGLDRLPVVIAAGAVMAADNDNALLKKLRQSVHLRTMAAISRLYFKSHEA